MVSEKIWGSAIGAFVAYGKDGATLVPLKVNADGELVVNLEAATVNIGDVDVLSSALPTGAATESTLSDIKTAVEGSTGEVTGAVTDSYVAIKTWACKGFTHKLSLLKNTDGANALKYKVTGYLYSGGLPEILIAETTLAANTQTALMVFDYPWAEIVFEVKNAVGASAADYQLDWAGGI